MSEAILASKMANALFANAQASVTDTFGAIANAAEKQRRIHGGLWVGGRAELTTQRLRFAANALNKAVHVSGEGLKFDIPLTQIVAVRLRKAFVTHIVDVDTPDGTYSMRCWGAQGFAAAVDTAVRNARSPR
jgi:hypothetical protein